MRPAPLYAALAVVVLATTALAQAPPASLLANGDFETATRMADWPDLWPRPEGASWTVEDGNHFLRLQPVKPGQILTVFRAIDVRAGDQAYELSFRVRTNGLKRGKENWHDGRIILDFKDAAGK